jgi:hypothetical protein
MGTARKPHNDWSGYICELRNKLTGDHNVVVKAADAGLCTHGGKYATICNKHGTIVNSTNLPGARASMKDATNFCDGCRELAIALEKETK